MTPTSPAHNFPVASSRAAGTGPSGSRPDESWSDESQVDDPQTAGAGPAQPRSAARGLLLRFVTGAARLAQRRPKTIVMLWLILVVGCVGAGSAVGTKSLTDTQSEVGQSAQADKLVARAGLRDPAVESILISSGSVARTRAATQALQARARSLPRVSKVVGPTQSRTLSRDGGRVALVQATLRGNPDDAGDHVAALEAAAASVQHAHPGTKLQESGEGSQDRALNNLINRDLSHIEELSLPITLVILVLAFGALVAAAVPLLLGLTSVAAAFGALGLVSHLAPNSSSTSSIVLLIGLAVGIDYSLFYIRREREERRRGYGSARRPGRRSGAGGRANRPAGQLASSALDAAAASVGRAILISGVTVMIALAGLLITGAGDFISMALGTILVVLIAVIGSLTVLPAALALLGDRVDHGRVPGYRRLRARRARREAAAGQRTGAWAALARVVTRHPQAALITTVCLLGALAVPTLQLRTAALGVSDMPQSLPIVQATSAIERAFPGAPQDAELVVSGRQLQTPVARRGLAALGKRALKATGGRGEVTVVVAASRRLARVDVPMPEQTIAAEQRIVKRLRQTVAPTAAGIKGVHGTALVSGDAAANLDYSSRMKTATPEVIVFVLGLGFLLLLASFRAPLLAISVMALNMLSIGAAYGLLVSVFQHTWAEHLLDFQNTGHVVDWLPLFMFVVLFGLSMDYTVLVLERIREARLAGRTPRQAAAEGVAATAGTVTSAAFVMVAVFAVFAIPDLSLFKQLGVGLAIAVLLDATVVRAVLLPAVVTLLGKRGWPVRRSRPAAEVNQWNDGRMQESVV
jgi:RND superfamily putative drug exporter